MKNELEIFLIASLMHPTNALINIYEINNPFLQFTLWVIIPYFCILKRNLLIYVFLLFFSLIFLKKKPKQIFSSKNEQDSLRSCVIVLVTIAIFACDFGNFPNRHLKTKFYGASLMDLGVGSFLFNNGLFVSFRSKFSIFKSSMVLLLLGFVRLFVIILFNYHVDLSEYGAHFNFYFVMGLVFLLYIFLESKFNFHFSVLLLLVYQSFLSNGLEKYIFSENRISFLEKNKEGIFMIFPSYCIFSFADQIGRILYSSENQLVNFYKGFLYFLTFFYGFWFSREKIEMSRRLCNATFVFWIVVFHCAYALLAKVTSSYCGGPCKFVSFCAKNMLFIFLWSNLLVLLGNLIFDLKSFGAVGSVYMNLGYLGASFLLPYFLRRKSC